MVIDDKSALVNRTYKILNKIKSPFAKYFKDFSNTMAKLQESLPNSHQALPKKFMDVS